MKRFQLTYHEVKTKLIRAESMEEAQAKAHEYITDRNAQTERAYDATYRTENVIYLKGARPHIPVRSPFAAESLEVDGHCPTDVDYAVYRECIDAGRGQDYEAYRENKVQQASATCSKQLEVPSLSIVKLDSGHVDVQISSRDEDNV